MGPETKKPFITSISCGSNHVIALSKDNEVYSWGYGDMMALGNGRDQDELKPTKLNSTKFGCNGCTILQAEAGGQHSALLAAST